MSFRERKGLGVIETCAGCGRTKDLWEVNNGQGMAAGGQHYCCKPCSLGEDCICADLDAQKGQELSGLHRGVSSKRRRPLR